MRNNVVHQHPWLCRILPCSTNQEGTIVLFSWSSRHFHASPLCSSSSSSSSPISTSSMLILGMLSSLVKKWKERKKKWRDERSQAMGDTFHYFVQRPNMVHFSVKSSIFFIRNDIKYSDTYSFILCVSYANGSRAADMLFSDMTTNPLRCLG